MAEIKPIEIPVALKPVEPPAIKLPAYPTYPAYQPTPTPTGTLLASFILGLIAGFAIAYFLTKKGYIP